MSDVISRQAAIDTLDEQIEQCNKSLSSFDISMKDEYAVKVERASLVAFREILEYLPPAQLSTNLAEVGTDCISRQAAIEALVAETIYTEEELKEYYEANSHRNEWVNGIHEAVEVIKQLPPAQPAIVPCNYVKACNEATMDKLTSAVLYLNVLEELKKHGYVLVDMREVER